MILQLSGRFLKECYKLGAIKSIFVIMSNTQIFAKTKILHTNAIMQKLLINGLLIL